MVVLPCPSFIIINFNLASILKINKYNHFQIFIIIMLDVVLVKVYIESEMNSL